MFKRALFIIFISTVLSTNVFAATVQKGDLETTLTQMPTLFQNLVNAANTHFSSSNKVTLVNNKVNKQIAEPAQVPLPATLWLLAPVLIGLTQIRRQQKNNTP